MKQAISFEELLDRKFKLGILYGIAIGIGVVALAFWVASQIVL